jgi:hypothetical protein
LRNLMFRWLLRTVLISLGKIDWTDRSLGVVCALLMTLTSMLRAVQHFSMLTPQLRCSQDIKCIAASHLFVSSRMGGISKMNNGSVPYLKVLSLEYPVAPHD